MLLLQPALLPPHVRPTVERIFELEPRITSRYFNELYEKQRACFLCQEEGIRERYHKTRDFFEACSDFIDIGNLMWTFRDQPKTVSRNELPASLYAVFCIYLIRVALAARVASTTRASNRRAHFRTRDSHDSVLLQRAVREAAGVPLVSRGGNPRALPQNAGLF